MIHSQLLDICLHLRHFRAIKKKKIFEIFQGKERNCETFHIKCLGQDE